MVRTWAPTSLDSTPRSVEWSKRSPGPNGARIKRLVDLDAVGALLTQQLGVSICWSNANTAIMLGARHRGATLRSA